ncbi:winged helix-turn-helix domain-containing protein [Streptomyces longispororuber]|uniref:winged helix-turn-helix domain-containing protein n=1 Tax=Streptomyces longispororuber TaxID=68230 RepID=UPI00210A0A17|nr:winged helix-turn-helix domain-containing protein [Streptomyces longispororuber]MCQ4212485.1 winged helix-turn-helix domain-containing protein [Streptomyces longispororuber]
MASGQSGSGGREVFRVVEELRSRISGGVYPVDSLLPAQRRLATEFSVSRDTVQRALEQLKAEGWIEARQGSGTAVVQRVLKEQQVQSYTAKAAVEGRVSLRAFFDEAFSGPEVVLDVYTLTSESLDTQVKGQIERIRSGEVAPRRISIRMLLPSASLDLPYPRALDDPGGDLTAQLKQRLLDITHRHSESIRTELLQLRAEELVEQADILIRYVDLTPTFKLYLINDTQALHGPYEVIERPIVLGDEAVPSLDVLGLGATLTHYVVDPGHPDARGSVFVESWQTWFESVWTTLAR